MSLIEILAEIRKQGLEVEVYEQLQVWLLHDREKWISRAVEAESSLRVVKKLANSELKVKEALIGIKNICESEEE